jgi:hypothetical protein
MVNLEGISFNEVVIQKKGSSKTEKSYLNISNHVYTLRSESLGDEMAADFEYLNDTAKVNYTWTKDIAADATTNEAGGRIIGTIKEKGISKAVKGVTYKNVVHTQLTVQYDMGDNFQDVVVYHFYAAKAIGIIQIDADVSLFGINLKTSTQLQSYSIK